MKLPLNCSVEYFQDFLSGDEAAELYRLLIEEYELDREQHLIEVAGKLHKTDTFKILFSTPDLIAQDTHPENIHGKSYEWSGEMASLRKKVEEMTEATFKIAMCLYYPDGNFSAPYHFDQETSGYKTLLPSISLGEVREFTFREMTTGEVYSLKLDDGSMLLMGDHCQSRYEHSLPKDPTCKKGRINITFREPDFK